MLLLSLISRKKKNKTVTRQTGQVWNLKPNVSQTYRSAKSQPGHVVKNGEEGEQDRGDLEGHIQRYL
jgi:hypothetical protein